MSRESAGLVVNAAALSGAAPSADVASRLRASFLVIGPLLARLGVAHVPLVSDGTQSCVRLLAL